MTKIFTATILYLFLFPLVSLSQNTEEWNEEIDAIRSRKDISDSLKITSISDLFVDKSYLLDAESLHTYLDNVLPLVGQKKKHETKAYIYSFATLLTTDTEQKIPLLDSCMFYLEKIDNNKIRAIGWNNIGKAQKRNGHSLEYFQKALSEIEGKNYYKQETETFMNMASFYKNRKDHSNQVKYSKEALESAKKGSDNIFLIRAWNCLGEAYADMPTNDLENEALNAFNTALDIYKEVEQTNNSQNNNYLHIVLYVNLGNINYHLEEEEIASNYLHEALIIAVQYNIVEYQILCYKYLAAIDRYRGEYQNAADYLVKAEALLPEIFFYNENNWNLLYDIYFDLAAVYQSADMPKESAQYMQIAIEEYRKVFDLQLAYDSQILTSSYEVQQREQEIENAQSLLSLKKRQTLLYIAIAVILCIGLFFIYKLFNYRISVSKESEDYKSKEIEFLKLEKSYITLQNELKLQESEGLQKQLVLGGAIVKQKNKIFENLKEFFTTHSEFDKYKEQIENILTQQNRIESNVEDLKNISKGVPADFYAQLQEYANNKLTLLDLKYCRLIYLDTPTKDMANLLYVEPSTIRVSKYRLKQKLNLNKDADLNSFIQNIAKQALKN